MLRRSDYSRLQDEEPFYCLRYVYVRTFCTFVMCSVLHLNTKCTALEDELYYKRLAPVFLISDSDASFNVKEISYSKIAPASDFGSISSIWNSLYCTHTFNVCKIKC